MSEFTVMRASDAPDYTGDAPGAFLGYGRPMGAGQLAFNVRVLEPGQPHVPPGEDPDWGHAHATIEEIYFVIEGEVTAKLGDELVTLGPRDAVLIPAGTVRGVRNDGDRQAVFAMCSVRVEDQRSESRPEPGFWTGETR